MLFRSDDETTLEFPDGHRAIVPIYRAMVAFGGLPEREIYVHGFGDEVLLGVGLMAGLFIAAEVRPGGAVTAEPLS